MIKIVSSKYHIFYFFFFNDTATTEIYTLSLHDALPILHLAHRWTQQHGRAGESVPKLTILTVDHRLRPGSAAEAQTVRSEEHTSELQSPCNLVCRLLLEKKKICHTYVL